MGLTFPDALGLAAGFDKNAVGIDALAALGFGFVEVGTVTGEPQPGNPRPRLFRLPADRAVVNRMGFNNDGAEVVARRLARAARPRGAATVVLGRQHRQDQGGPRGRRGRRARRLREERPAARAVRRLPGGQRQLAEHPRPARPAGGRAARSRCSTPYDGSADDGHRPARAAAGEDRPRPRRRRRARGRRPGRSSSGLDGIIATNTTISRDGLRLHRRARSRRPAPAGCPGAPLPSACAGGAAAAARPGRRRTSR